MFLATRFILFIKESIEKISQLIEYIIWYSRNTIIRILGLFLFVPTIFYFVSYAKRALANGNSEILLIICLILLTELIVRFLNFKNRLNSNRPIATLVDRILSILPYIWAIIEISRGLAIPLSEYFRYYPQIFDPFYYVLHMYESLPGHQFGLVTLAIFGLLFFGVGRNHLMFPFVVRYHAVQAILTEAVFYFNIHLFQLWAERRVSDDFLVTKVALMMYGYMVFSYCLLSFTALLGIPTRITFLHEAIVYHIDEEDSNRDNLNR